MQVLKQKTATDCGVHVMFNMGIIYEVISQYDHCLLYCYITSPHPSIL